MASVAADRAAFLVRHRSWKSGDWKPRVGIPATMLQKKMPPHEEEAAAEEANQPGDCPDFPPTGRRPKVARGLSRSEAPRPGFALPFASLTWILQQQGDRRAGPAQDRSPARRTWRPDRRRSGPAGPGAMHLLINRAPKPKPMMTMPVARPFLVGKPLGDGGHGGDVAQPQAGSTDHSIAQVKQEQAAMMEGDGREQISQSGGDPPLKASFRGPNRGKENAAPGRPPRPAANGQAERPIDLGIRPAVGVGQRLNRGHSRRSPCPGKAAGACPPERRASGSWRRRLVGERGKRGSIAGKGGRRKEDGGIRD